jgi:hypothetical protein
MRVCVFVLCCVVTVSALRTSWYYDSACTKPKRTLGGVPTGYNINSNPGVWPTGQCAIWCDINAGESGFQNGCSPLLPGGMMPGFTNTYLKVTSCSNEAGAKGFLFDASNSVLPISCDSTPPPGGNLTVAISIKPADLNTCVKVGTNINLYALTDCGNETNCPWCLGVGAIIGIAIGGIWAVILIALGAFYCRNKRWPWQSAGAAPDHVEFSDTTSTAGTEPKSN